MKKLFGQLFGSLFGGDKQWWVEIKTENPACTYYFGPFDIAEEAELAKGGYIEDLEQEGAQDIQVTVMRCKQPAQLTIEGQGTHSVGEPPPALSRKFF